MVSKNKTSFLKPLGCLKRQVWADMEAALQSPVLKKAEEKATVKREDGKSNEESPSAKRLCGIYEKKVSKLPAGDLSLVKDFQGFLELFKPTINLQEINIYNL